MNAATTRVKNHRIAVTRRGGPDVLAVVEEELPEPGPGEARIRVEAAGVSGYDVMLRSRSFPGFPRVPYTPGEDVVGVVDKLGEGVSDLEPEQRVAAWTFGRAGGYTEFICLPTTWLVPVPSEVGSAEAVALVVNYLTAHLALHLTASVQTGERILVHGAAGGVGTALVQLGKLAELEVYGTASKRNHELVFGLGAVPIDYHAEDFVMRIHSLTGDGVDVVIDPIGGARQLWRSYRTLRTGGRLVMLGMAATSKRGMKVIPLSMLTIGLIKLIPANKTAPLSPSMTKYPHMHNDWYRKTLAGFFDLAAAGVMVPVVGEHVPLAEAGLAHGLVERNGHAGKVVLTTI